MLNINLIRGVFRDSKYGKCIFYVALTIYMLVQFSTGTMIYDSLHIPWYISADLVYFSVFLVLVKIFFFDGFSDLKEMLIYVSVGLLLLIGCNNTLTYDIVYYYLFIVGARNIGFDKIAKIFLVGIGFTLICTIIAAKLGIIMGLTVGRSDSPVIRYALGTVYATDLAARTFYLQLMYVVLRKFRLTLPEYIAGFAFSIMMYIITDTRVDFILMLATLFLALGYKYVVDIIDFLGTKVMILLGLVSIFGMIGLTYLYTPKYGILRILDKILSTRLQNGHGAFENYNVTVFGQYIFQQGNGGLHKGAFHYFFIDCTFVRVLMMNGVITFALFVWALCYMLKRFMDKQSYSLVIAIILVVISSLIDHHMTEISFNIIFLAMFSNIDYFSKYSKNNSLFSI